MWAEPDVAGFLDKRGGTFTSWKSRFFILQGSTLFYFPNPYNIQSPLGVLPMEGSGLEAAGIEEGGPQRKWCFRIKLGAQFGMAKRSTYVFAAPSKQAQEEWLDNLKYAASTRADLIASLHKSRRVGAALRFRLSRSPANLKIIAESKRGHEGYVLQTEMEKLRANLVTFSKQASETRSEVELAEAEVMRALAAWDVFAHHLHDKSMWDYRDKLQNELNLSKELNQLLASKADFMEGHKLDLLDEDARTELRNICERALTKIQEHQAKVTANKKLLALQRRAANDNRVEARSGWLVSKVGTVKSVSRDTAKSAVQNVAAEFNKDMSTISKFIDTEVSTVNKFVGKEVLAVSKFMEKSKAKGTAATAMAKGKALTIAAGLKEDIKTLNKSWSKEMLSFNNFIDKGKESAKAKGKAIHRGGEAILKGGVFKAGIKRAVASLGWTALNRMKLQGSMFSGNLLTSGKSRPGSADPSPSRRNFWKKRPGSSSSLTSGGRSRPRLISKPQKFQREYGTSGFVSDEGEPGAVFAVGDADAGQEAVGFVSHDGRTSAMFFDEAEDRGPQLRRQPSVLEGVLAKHSNILSTVPGFRRGSLSQLSQNDFDNSP
ncbi:hypothetical protein AXG93_1762s1150 [Marchantia polymorpha subsp. ruderalis]|uniref:PH domain-containing protein n=1 Tax=Marchantia polymorpha subsp. ruderalis TaxID=1480154 RepID=A0A176WBM5_MARPO|nr:hypothetical protein AXG93_1762s1150 [Marchantia polymorpha subsp. ruderalis]